jgi:hypothetical protein
MLFDLYHYHIILGCGNDTGQITSVHGSSTSGITSGYGSGTSQITSDSGHGTIFGEL